MSAPGLGDPVTYLDHSDRPLLVHARWGEPHAKHPHPGGVPYPDEYALRRDALAGRVFLAYVLVADEGITWVREHVSDKDEKGRALLAYGALSAEPRGKAYSGASLEIAMAGLSFSA